MRGLTRAGAVAAGAIVVVYLAIAVVVTDLPASSPVTLGIRLASLWGLLAMGIAALMSPFLAEIRRVFGRPFLGVHHVFAAFGLSAITLHPILVATRAASALILIPSLPLLDEPVLNAGRIALPLIYIAVVGALLRGRLGRWRYLHLVIYLALVLGVIHGAVLSQFFFGNPFLAVLYLGLGAAILGAFVAKRWQRWGRTRPAPHAG